MKRTSLTLAAASLVSSICVAEGVYRPVEIDADEQRMLIDSSAELEGYFNSQSLIYGDADLLSLVRGVGHMVAPPPTDDYIGYEFFILRDPSPNAFALPNGHVYITTGMLARLEDEAQLAAILSHEVNHVAGHHGIIADRATTRKAVAIAVISGLGSVAGAHYDAYGDASSAWAQLTAQVLSTSLAASVYGFSRELEQEADVRAVALLADSPYDPGALPEVFEILMQDYEGLNPRVQSIWSTHPELELRVQIASALVAGFPERDRDVEGYELAVHSLRTMTIQDYVQDDYPHTAIALAESLAERFPQDPRVLTLLGDSWQALGARSRADPEEWTNRDKRRNRRDRRRNTREERLAELLETEEGRAVYAQNLSEAEQVYRRVLALDADYADAHRGLGEVYEQMERPRDAAAEYLAYVRSAPEAHDRVVILDRLRTLGEQIRTQN